MFQNRKFGFCTVILCLAGFMYMFLCACLEGGELEMYRSQLAGGWAGRPVAIPVTVGALLSVPQACLCLTGYIRHGVRRGMIVWGAAAALGCVGLMNADDVYWLFCASTVLIRCACTALQIGIAVLCVQWFIRCRGRVLGLVTMGAPLFSAVGAASMADFIQTRLGGDARPFYLAVAALLALLALAVRFLLRDRPEDTGLYPDGEGFAPDDLSETDESPLTVRAVLKNKRAWLLLLAFGGYIAAGAGCVGSTPERFLELCGKDVWASAAPWLALGPILALPVSYGLGWVSDKLGAGVSGVILGLFLLLTPAALWRLPPQGSVPWELGWSLGAAFILGGVPTVLPCALAQVFGRRQYLAGARVLLPALLLIAAAAPPAAWLLPGGGVYAALLAAGAVGLAAAIALALTKDKSQKGA